MQKQEAETLTTNNPNDSPQTPELSGTENEAIVTGIPEDDGTERPESALPEHTEDTDEGQKDPVEEEDKTGEEKDNEETEVLYGIITAKVQAYLAPYSSGTPYDMTLKPVIAVSKADSVSFSPDSGAYADIATVTALQTQISGMLRIVDITVPASGWSSTVPYTQTITVDGMKSTDTPLIGPALDKTTTAADVKAYKKVAGLIDGGDTTDGAIELYCNTAKPSVDAKIRLMGVSASE